MLLVTTPTTGKNYSSIPIFIPAKAGNQSTIASR